MGAKDRAPVQAGHKKHRPQIVDINSGTKHYLKCRGCVCYVNDCSVKHRSQNLYWQLLAPLLEWMPSSNSHVQYWYMMLEQFFVFVFNKCDTWPYHTMGGLRKVQCPPHHFDKHYVHMCTICTWNLWAHIWSTWSFQMQEVWFPKYNLYWEIPI